MFRLMRLKPPHGWNAVAWELGIVTLGVIVALAAQQAVEELSWRSDTSTATTAIRREMGDHYASSVEWRMVTPCMTAQIDRLQARLMNSGDRLDPAPVYSEPAFPRFVLRIPSKEYDSSAWEAAISDGVTAHLKPELRTELSEHYQQVSALVNMTQRNGISYGNILAFSRPMPLDPSVRLTLSQLLDELRGRVMYMDLTSGQLSEHINRAGMVPDEGLTREAVRLSGTRLFCADQHLPMRSLKDAEKPIPYKYSPQPSATLASS
jgi:hypothetical protein